MYFLGISAYYHDSSVALIDSSRKLVDFKKEEWLSRVKGDKSFPRQSLQELIDRYEGKDLTVGKISQTFRITYRSKKNTLTAQEIEPIQENIMKNV